MEILRKTGARWQRLLNALQTRRGRRRAAATNSVLARRNQFRQPCVSSRIMPKVRRTMRSEKSLFNALLTHFLMGVALGLSLVLLLSLIDAFHVRDLIAKSGAPVQTTVMLVTTYALMFGIGATLTGLVLTLEDES
ncbi:MAG TPA: hypothetical protein VMT72_22605 [Pseudolabrys sp.]|nr:hypothetical protein [Pseudolabrys sp.]